MNATTYTAYRLIRQKYYALTAKQAYQFMQEEQKDKNPTLPWEEKKDGLQKATIELDGFTVHVNVTYDYEYDFLENRGRFSSRWQPGALRNPASRWDNHVYEWFIPETTEEEQYKSLRDMNIGKAQAREMARQYVREDMEIAINPDSAGYYAVVVSAKAYKKGVELGWDTCGMERSIRDTTNDLDECAWNCIHEAVSEAKEKLAALQE